MPTIATVSWPEAIWCVCVVLGIVLNAVFMWHSHCRVRYVIDARAPGSIVEASKAIGIRDGARLFQQLCFVYPGYRAITTPNRALDWQAWAFILCLVLVEVSLVALSAFDAIHARRIARLRLEERDG